MDCAGKSIYKRREGIESNRMPRSLVSRRLVSTFGQCGEVRFKFEGERCFRGSNKRKETETKRNKHCFDRISLVVLVDGGLVPFVLFHFDELPNNGNRIESNRIESNRTMTVHCDICCENENEECIGMSCHEIREMPCHDMGWDTIALHTAQSPEKHPPKRRY